MAELLGEEELRILASLEKGLTVKSIARAAGLPYSRVLRRLEELSGRFVLRLLPRFGELGLVPTATLSRVDAGPPPFTTLRIRAGGVEEYRVHIGLVPAPYLERFSRDAAGEVALRGLELAYWSPLSASQRSVDLGDERLLALPEEQKPASGAPDRVDLALLSYKIGHPFMKLSEAYLRAMGSGGWLPEVSRQALAYHYRRHVKPRLVGLRAYPLDPDEPLQLVYLEGWRAPAAARAASVLLPGFIFALIDRGRALVLAQLDSRQRIELYRVVRGLRVGMPLGELLAEDVEAYQLRLWEAEERRSWTYTWTGVRVKKPFFP